MRAAPQDLNLSVTIFSVQPYCFINFLNSFTVASLFLRLIKLHLPHLWLANGNPASDQIYSTKTVTFRGLCLSHALAKDPLHF